MITHALEDWLCVSTDESPILLVEPPIVKRSRREKWEHEMFSLQVQRDIVRKVQGSRTDDVQRCCAHLLLSRTNYGNGC